MKIAVVTEDENTIHSHFGQAPYYQVLTIQDNRVVAQERRDKPAHQGHHEHGGQEHHHACRDSHASDMAAVVSDCEIVMARGMGQPAFRQLRAAGIQPILVSEKTIADAVQALLNGQLQNRVERVHQHEPKRL